MKPPALQGVAFVGRVGPVGQVGQAAQRLRALSCCGCTANRSSKQKPKHMSNILIKICGFRTADAAIAAAEAGADMLGFNFYPKSSRYIEPEDAAKISRALPSGVTRVGVFVNEPVERVRSIAEACGFDTVQLHGDYTQEDIAGLTPLRVILALGVSSASDLDKLEGVEADFILLDAAVKGMYGGTGRSFDWRLAAEARKHTAVPIILAGGLKAANVRQAIRQASPNGVDVAGGVESAPGVKDISMIEKFIAAVKRTRLKP